MCVQIWKPGNDHSTKLNIIAIFSNYCIIPIQSMHDFLIHKIILFRNRKKIFFESLDELKMKLISILHNTLKGFNFINDEFELLLSRWLYDKIITDSTLNYKWYFVAITDMIRIYKIKCDELLSIKEQVLKGICFINQASIQRWLCIPKWVIRWWAFILHLAMFVLEKISKHRHSFWLYLLICTHMSQKMHHKYLWSIHKLMWNKIANFKQKKYFHWSTFMFLPEKRRSDFIILFEKDIRSKQEITWRNYILLQFGRFPNHLIYCFAKYLYYMYTEGQL